MGGRQKSPSWRRVLGALSIGCWLIVGSFGSSSGPVDIGEQVVSAQGRAIAGRSGTMPLAGRGPERAGADPIVIPSAQRAAMEAHMERAAAAMRARANRLPARDPQMATVASTPPAGATATVPTTVSSPTAPPPAADGDFAFFRASQLNPAAGGYSSSPINEPSIAQNGMHVFQTWNWGAARSADAGMTWSYINPAASMPDFCCDQDVIYDKGRDRMVWLRQGLPTLTCGVGCTENRDILSVTADGGATFCTYDLRPSAYGLTNAWFDYPRLSLSNNFLYLGTNVFDSLSSAFVTHVLLRLSLSDLAGCAPLAYTVWTFSDGWTPALVETAREIMYMGDQIVTNTGLNDQFRVYWIFDNSTTLNFVDRTIAPYLFTNRGTAHCPGPGGYDPCQRADQRITGAVVQHNTPVPGTLGAAGDKIDFYWNVREGNGFPLPYTESAGFQGNTINYVQRKFIWSNALTFFYAAAGANDREHVALSLLGFYPAATGIHPVHLVALDDDFNGNPPAWETHPIASSSGAWTTDGAGDFLRVRTHSPAGVGWIASGYVRNATQSQYAPMFTVFGRARDLNGMARFDQR